jgi:uncharacterized protein YgiM (DUF1202 family)
MTRPMRLFWISLFVVGAFTCSSAQKAIVRRNTTVRAGPSSSEAKEGTLSAGDIVSILDATPEHGYYQVQTVGGKDGWVFSKSLRIVASPSASQPATDPESTTTGAGDTCDETLWTHVYHPTRLVVKQPCTTVTGTIVDATNGHEPDGVRHEADGDTHGWLRVDAGFEDLLNPGNLNNEGGNLVFEIVCEFRVTQADAQPACNNFASSVNIPPVGSHVQIVGSYVRDTNHAQWMEIHPVTSIKIIP